MLYCFSPSPPLPHALGCLFAEETRFIPATVVPQAHTVGVQAGVHTHAKMQQHVGRDRDRDYLTACRRGNSGGKSNNRSAGRAHLCDGTAADQ